MKRWLIFPTLLLLLTLSTSASADIYYPHVHSDGNWETMIGLVNTSTAGTVSGTFSGFDGQGSLVSQQSVSLAPLSRKVIMVGQGFSSPEQIRYILFQTTSTTVEGFVKFTLSGHYRAALPAISEITGDILYIPHVASDSDWWTGIGLVNTASTAKAVTIRFDDGATLTRTLAGNAHDAFTIRSLFDDQPQSGLHWAVIENAAGVIGMELFGSTAASGDNYLSGIILSDSLSTGMYYPHVASDGEWWTGLVAFNPSGTSWQISISPYAADGTALAQQTVSPAGEKYIGTASDLALPAGTAWFRATASTPAVGFELFGSRDGNRLGGVANTGIEGRSGVFCHLETDGVDRHFLCQSRGQPGRSESYGLQ